MCSQKQKFGPIPNGTKVPLFSNLEEKKTILNFFLYFFLKNGTCIQSTHTHKLHGDILLQLNGNSMCNSLIEFVFFIDQK